MGASVRTLGLWIITLLVLVGMAPIAPGHATGVTLEWAQTSTDGRRFYLAQGANLETLMEFDQGVPITDRHNIAYTAAMTRGDADRGEVTITPLQACWSVRMWGSSQTLTVVWSDPACPYRVALPVLAP